MARRRPGIYEHPGLVYPYGIEITSRKVVAKQEEGFTFAIPEKLSLQLSIAFLESCLSFEKNPGTIKYFNEEIARKKERINEIIEEEKKEKNNSKKFIKK